MRQQTADIDSRVLKFYAGKGIRGFATAGVVVLGMSIPSQIALAQENPATPGGGNGTQTEPPATPGGDEFNNRNTNRNSNLNNNTNRNTNETSVQANPEQGQQQGQGQRQRQNQGQGQQQRATSGAESDQRQSATTGNNTTSIDSDYTDESINRSTAYGDLPGGIAGCKVLKGRQGGIFIGIPGVFVIEPQVTWSEGDMIEGCHEAAMEELQARQSHAERMNFLQEATKLAVETGEYTMVTLSVRFMAEQNNKFSYAWMKQQASDACHYAVFDGDAPGSQKARHHGESPKGMFDSSAHSGMQFVPQSALDDKQNRMMHNCISQALQNVDKKYEELYAQTSADTQSKAGQNSMQKDNDEQKVGEPTELVPQKTEDNRFLNRNGGPR